jgi:hypothetical protein
MKAKTLNGNGSNGSFKKEGKVLSMMQYLLM